LNEPEAVQTEAPADGGAQHPGGRIVVVDGPPPPGTKPADGPYPDGLQRLLALIAAQMPKGEVDAVWAFPGVRREGREYGVAVVSRAVKADGPADGRTDGPTEPEPERSEGEVGAGSRSDPGHGRTDSQTDGQTDGRDEAVERRRVYRARYVLELKGEKRGRATLELEEAALTPAALVHKVIEGVARRADEAGDAELVDLTAWKADDGVAG
jgi:hypothetical protein